MHAANAIRPIGQIFKGSRTQIPEDSGVYAFWWLGLKSDLMAANRHIVLKGPKKRPVEVEYRDWWPPELSYPCLYVGKSTNIKKRFSLHIKRHSSGRLHQPQPGKRKAKPCTTSCQLPLWN